MKFLLKLVLSGGLIASMATSPHEGMASTPSGSHLTDKDGMANSENTLTNGEYDLVKDLNPTLSISNPYASAADQPFTFVENNKAATSPLATTVYCGGYTWNDGELLGTNGNGEVRTAIIHDRIYIRIGGNITDNRFHLVHASGTRFPNTPENDALLKRCVNDLDPSTFTNGYLGPLVNGVIKCNNKAVTDNMLIGTYYGGDNVATEQYAEIQNGLLRITAWRRDGRPYNPEGFNTSVLGDIIRGDGRNGFNPALGYKLNETEINSCFWKDLPVYPESVANPPVNCESGPALTGTANISKTNLTFTYSGTGVNTIKWNVKKKSDNSSVATATTGALNGNTSVDISFGSSLAAGDYILEISGANCVSSTSSLPITIVEPVVVIPACQNGPGISVIKNVTASSLSIDFTGTNLHTFSWKILNGTYPVASGKTPYLNSNTAALTFNYLKNGDYTFELVAEDCVAPQAEAKTFTVNATDTRANCPKGPSIEKVLSTSENGLSFLFDGEEIYNIDWKIMSGNTLLRQNRVSPQSNHPTIQFETLPTGLYMLEIQGGGCKSTVSARQFGINMDAPLPIFIANFKGTVVEKGVELAWEVVSEKDGEAFEVLRFDENVKTPEVIGKVSLTDSRIGKYTFVDESPLLGMNYYQLKQIDTDGTFTKSNIISINPGLISGTVVAPNPASDFVNIQFSSRKAGLSMVEIYNVSGIKVSSSQLKITEGKNVHRINVGKLNEGNYFIKVSNGTAEAAKLRFVKAN